MSGVISQAAPNVCVLPVNAKTIVRVRQRNAKMKKIGHVLLLTVLGAFVFLAWPPYSAAAQDIVGVGRNVNDGDTFEIAADGHITKIRLCGIDAPESYMPGSNEAWKKLSELVYGKAVKCTQVSRNAGTVCDGRSRPTNRDRIVAQCSVHGGDIAAILVLAGVACDWPKYSGGYYQRLAEGKACTRD